jgi:hypothetical protein
VETAEEKRRLEARMKARMTNNMDDLAEKR